MNILAFFAHPDDETMLCGGTLALLARQGARVHYLCATRGEGGEAGEPPLCTQEELGTVRAAELTCAVQALGGASLTFLEYVDPRVGPGDQLYPFDADFAQLTAQVAACMERLEIDVLISHGSNGEYGHPAHLLTHRAAAAAASTGRAPLLYTVQAAYEQHPWHDLMNRSDPAHLILDVSPARAAKTDAALCHRTQHALFVRHASREANRPVSVPETIGVEESLHRCWPAVNGSAPSDALTELLLASGYARRG